LKGGTLRRGERERNTAVGGGRMNEIREGRRNNADI